MWRKGVVVHLLESGGVWCSSYTMVAGSWGVQYNSPSFLSLVAVITHRH